MDSAGKTEVCVLKYTSLSRYLTVQWIYPFKVLSGLVLLTRCRSLWKDELMGNGGNEQPILCGFRSFMWESESQLNANYVSQALNHEVIQKHRGCSVTPASELHCMKDEEETGQRLGRNVKGKQRKQMGPLSQIITHASGPGVCECWQRWDILQWLFVVNLKLSVTRWWPVLPLCATGHLMCRLMSCFTVPTVWHQHTFFISVNCSYLISDRDVNIHLQWSDHSWSATIVPCTPGSSMHLKCVPFDR